MLGDRGEEEGHLILCHDCGMAAIVPFKPLEGRKVFCGRCYRRRKEEERRTGERPRFPPRRMPRARDPR